MRPKLRTDAEIIADLGPLKELGEDFVTRADAERKENEDFDDGVDTAQWLFERSLEMLYGKDFWGWYNNP